MKLLLLFIVAKNDPYNPNRSPIYEDYRDFEHIVVTYLEDDRLIIYGRSIEYTAGYAGPSNANKEEIEEAFARAFRRPIPRR